MKKQFFPFLLLALFLISCGKTENIPETRWLNKTRELREHNTEKKSVTQGIYGTLIQAEGNCMPVIGEGSTCKHFPVAKKIRIYEYTLWEQTEHQFTIFSRIDTKLIATVQSDSEGFFEAELAPGTYSLFIEAKEGLYANRFDSIGGITPVTVEEGSVATIDLKLDYAVY